MGQITPFQVKQLNDIPWILPDGIGNGQKNSLSFLVSNIAGTASPLQGISTGNFQLSWNGLDAQITSMAGFNLFDTTPVNRKTVRDSLDAFIIALDQLEITHSLSPGSSRITAQMTAQYLPVPLSEIPLYAFNLVNPFLYGFLSPLQTYVDILPGMRLCVCAGNLYNESLDQTQLPAYGGNGNSYLYVNTIAGSNLLSYETFLDTMGIQVPVGKGSNIRTASGMVDFMSGGELQPYNRLFYPTAPSNSFPAINTPDNNPAKNATIVRADNYQNMLQYTSSFPYCCQAAAGRCVLFFGRTQMIPEISVRISGETIYVPIGTTLQHLVERSYTGITRPKNLKFSRYINQQSVSINFENATIGFTMFLVSGDDISW